MYTMLIVDDEKFATEGIRGCTDWSQLGIGHVLVAHHASEARKLLLKEKVDILICDIEMPDENGLSLVGWVREHSSDTETVFLTCHSEFQYAKQALQLSSFDYLLKPVDSETLIDVVRKMIVAIMSKADMKRFERAYKQNEQLWSNQEQVLAEKFWQDYLARRVLPFGDFLERALATARMTIGPDDKVMPILISIEEWKKPLNSWDQDVMEYAVKKAAAEILLEGKKGHVIHDRSGLIFVMIYESGPAGGEQASALNKEQWRELAERLIQSCSSYFYCELSLYIGSSVPFRDLLGVCDKLYAMERTNVTDPQSVKLAGQATPVSISSELTQEKATIIGWSDMMLNGEREKLTEKISQLLISVQKQTIGPDWMDTFYHDMLQIVYHFLHVRGMGINQIPNFSLWTSAKIKNLSQLHNWSINLVNAVMNAAYTGKEVGVIDKAIQYIDQHVEEELSRESVAAHVGLNPAYLSRLFRREKEQNLVDYLIEAKMKRAQVLLDATSMSVSQVAQQVGYSNFSHFAKTFKKLHGMNPQDYRRR